MRDSKGQRPLVVEDNPNRKETNMTSRERFELTLNHKDPGQVVVDIGGTVISGISALALHNLRAKLGLPPELVKVSDPFQILGEVEEEIRSSLGLDVIMLSGSYNMFGFENANYKPWPFHGAELTVPGAFNTKIEADGTIFQYPCGDMSAPPCAQMPKDGYYFDNITRTFGDFDEEHADGRADFAVDFPVMSEEQVRLIEERAKYYYENTDYGMALTGLNTSFGDVAILPGPAVKYPKGIRDVSEWLIAHHTMPDYVHEVYSLQLENGMKNAKMLKEAVGDRAQAVIVSGADFGTQRAPYISPDMYREFYKPYHMKMNDWIHENTNWKTFFHSCGSIMPLLEDMREAGVDILNPVQCSADNMDAATLKAKYGNDIVFWGGGVDTQQTLPFGTPEEVYNEVSERLKVFAPGGGFVFSAVHNIQAPTKPENILAMFEAIRDYNNK